MKHRIIATIVSITTVLIFSINEYIETRFFKTDIECIVFIILAIVLIPVWTLMVFRKNDCRYSYLGAVISLAIWGIILMIFTIIMALNYSV